MIKQERGDGLPNVLKYLMLVAKVLINLKVKLGRLEAANKKLVGAFKQSEDAEGAE